MPSVNIFIFYEKNWVAAFAMNFNLDHMLGHLIRRLNQQSMAVSYAHLKEAGFDITTVQFAVLNTLGKNPGLDQTTLANRIAYDRATTGGVVKRLEQKKLVQRLPHLDDRRAIQIWLSAEGIEALAKMRPVVMQLQIEILPNLTTEERKTLKSLIEKALGNKAN
jgi:DNA-binding MarR family transcriptional regulator